jgi:hypothetical protein
VQEQNRMMADFIDPLLRGDAEPSENRIRYFTMGERQWRVIEPQSIEEKSEAAAKEKITETIEANTPEESSLPLAAEGEAAPESVPVAAMPSPWKCLWRSMAMKSGSRRETAAIACWA